MIEKEVIHWSDDIQLNVSNFMAEPNPGIFEDSHSVIKYGFTWVVNSEQLDDQVVFSVENIQLSVEFNPLLSWIRMSEFNDGLLQHEQGHFDLAEIVKRKHQKIFENEFYKKHFPTRGQNDAQRKQYAKEDSGKMISLKVEKLNLYLKEKRDEYDQETNYGKNISEQKKYDEIFSKLRK